MRRRMLYPMLISLGLFLVSFVIIGTVTSYSVKVVSQDTDLPITVAHLSDTHLKDYSKQSTFRSAIESLNDSDVDLVVFTGDMFQHGDIDDDLKQLAIELFSSIQGEHKYAVLGNHDYDDIDTLQTVKTILNESGFVLLVNEDALITIDDVEYHLIGLDDHRKGDTEYDTILATTQDHTTNLVLSHEPDTFNTVSSYDVLAMFAGHSHGGQVRIPFVGGAYNVPGAKEYRGKHYRINDSELFITYGLGESMIPLRMFNPRQIEIYEHS